MFISTKFGFTHKLNKETKIYWRVCDLSKSYKQELLRSTIKMSEPKNQPTTLLKLSTIVEM